MSEQSSAISNCLDHLGVMGEWRLPSVVAGEIQISGKSCARAAASWSCQSFGSWSASPSSSPM